ncbi:hypothetical protein IGB42_01286 [Andreprevotia sp. IGB-42]|uniref:hypothetical protein n=1 Tax=Andreprevotia sp. IGB-42 TaxID=2497473 RepID=UPI00135947B1|nr:hypothetical protein [Andreprevotia sp. IGB-42]KAF0814385.1 hypothetical protein IGB42_01286 [Andreprevotia sp. IGB-42]
MVAAQLDRQHALLAALDECMIGQRYRLPGDDADLIADAIAALHVQKPGQATRLDFTTSLLSNLRVWENLILPAWYHRLAELPELETRVLAALQHLQLSEDAVRTLLDSLPATLAVTRKQELVLVRTLVLAPRYIFADADWCAWVERSPSVTALWQAICEHSILLMPGGEAGLALPDAAVQDMEREQG